MKKTILDGETSILEAIELQDGKGPGEAIIKVLEECSADFAQMEVPSGRVSLFPASLICPALTGDEE